MKPRRWLAYTVEVNDLLPCFEEIVDRFEQSQIPLDGTFGSNTTPGHEVPGLLIALGPAVEPRRLDEVVSLLTGLGKLFLIIHDEATHSKYIGIGALNLNSEPVVAISEPLRALLRRPDATASELSKALAASPRVHLFAAGGGKE
jgi:hypothetical protein